MLNATSLKLSLFLFALLGLTSFLPFYSFMASAAYWIYYYDVSFITIICTAFSISELIATVIQILLDKKLKQNTVIPLALVGNILALFFIIAFKFLDYQVRYWLTILPIAMSGMACSFFNVQMSSYAARLGDRFMNSSLIGVGASQVFIHFVRIIVKLCYSIDSKQADYPQRVFINNIIYYVICVIYLLVSIFIWVVAERITKPLTTKRIDLVDIDEPRIENIIINTTGPVIQSEKVDLLEVVQIDQTSKRCAILRGKEIPSCIAMIMTQLITYLIYPTMIVNIPYYATLSPTNRNEDWWTMIAFLVQYIGDLTGCICCFTHRFRAVKVDITVAICYVRMLLIIIFMLFSFPKVQFSGDTLISSPTIQIQWLVIVLIAVFGFSQGVCTSWMFGQYLQLINDDKQRGSASKRMTLSYNLGLTIAGFLGLAVAAALQ